MNGRWLSCLLLLLSGCGPADLPETPPDPSAVDSVPFQADMSSPRGVWDGSITFAGSPQSAVAALDQDEDGNWVGQLDIGPQTLLLSAIEVEGSSVSFALLTGGPDTLEMAGVMSEDGSDLSGTLSQGDATGSFELTRTDRDPAEAMRVTTTTAGSVERVEGSWQGAADSPQGTIEIVFRVFRSEAGDYSATVDLLDQGLTGVPIALLTVDGSLVRFQSSVGQYQGTLDEDDSAITGTWNGTPLTFERTSD